jgi:hypothetical protein
MNENIKRIKSFLLELREQKDLYKSIAPEALGRRYRRGKDGTDIVKDSSFLYIRSYEGDIGVRPFSGISAWLSPDIQISPITNVGDFGTTLHAGHAYDVQVSLHNRGDITVPYPKVELFLTTPTLGFDTRFADLIGLTQFPGLLLSGEHNSLHYTYQVPAGLEGHRCLFARTYSFSPLDKPSDPFALEPTLDRHIAQKNLNFVAQNTEYQFNLIHLPNALERIVFLPLSRENVADLMLPSLLRYKFADLPRMGTRMEVRAGENSKVRVKNGARGVELYSEGDGWGIGEQAGLLKMLGGAVNGEEKRTLQAAYREMNKYLMCTPLAMKIPDLGLGKGQFAALHLSNSNEVQGQMKGGITLIVMG